MPAGPPPPGGDQHIGYHLIVLRSFLIVPATMIIALRLYTRARITRSLGLDDFFIVLALLLSWLLYVFFVIAVDAGQGRHAYYLSKHQLLRFSKVVHIALPIITIATACSRLSISIFLLRIVNPGRRWKHGLWALITFITINYVAMFISAYLQCIPVQKNWNTSVHGSCWSKAAQSGTNIWQGCFSTICDFVLAILPIFFLWDVQISMRKKLGICILMGFGIITGICAIVRTVLTTRPVSAHPDPTRDTMDSAIWASLEELFLLIAASVPALQPLFKKKKLSRGYTSSGYQRSGETRLKSKSSARDPYAIDYDDGIAPSMDSQILSSKPTIFSTEYQEIKLHKMHVAERAMV